MANMSYCRFRNTSGDLTDCLDVIREGDDTLSESEARAGLWMFQDFLTFCRDYDIIDEFDGERLEELFNDLKEKPDEDDDC